MLGGIRLVRREAVRKAIRWEVCPLRRAEQLRVRKDLFQIVVAGDHPVAIEGVGPLGRTLTELGPDGLRIGAHPTVAEVEVGRKLSRRTFGICHLVSPDLR